MFVTQAILYTHYVPVCFHFLSPKRAFWKKLNQKMHLVNPKHNFFIKVAFWALSKNEGETRRAYGPLMVHKWKRAMRVLYITIANPKITEIPISLSRPHLSSVSFSFVFFLFVFLCFFTGLPPQSTKPISTFDIPNIESTKPNQKYLKINTKTT